MLTDLRDEHTAVRRLLAERDLAAPSGAAGWSLRDCVVHLWQTDRAAHWAATEPEAFLAHLPEVAADPQGYLDSWLRLADGLDDAALLDRWDAQLDDLVAVLGGLPDGTRVPWYGPPMAPASMGTARLMEYWAHGLDIADGLGLEVEPTARLRHIAHLGVRTRGYAYANRGLPLPDGEVRVTLAAPDGSTWEWGAGDDAVEGTALDFCMRVTRRRPVGALGLRTTGPLAAEWMDIAQCFAGPPGEDPR